MHLVGPSEDEADQNQRLADGFHHVGAVLSICTLDFPKSDLEELLLYVGVFAYP
jgi:hypothetical protein